MDSLVDGPDTGIVEPDSVQLEATTDETFKEILVLLKSIDAHLRELVEVTKEELGYESDS